MEQVAYQLNVGYTHKVSGAFVLLPLVEELEDIPDKQKKAFLKTARELMTEFEEEVIVLRKRKEEKIWEALPENIRKRLREKIGDIVYEKVR